MGLAQLRELEKHGFYLSAPKGVSMNPMLYQNDSVAEIHAIKSTPQKYDVVMYIRSDGVGVIHRILYHQGDYFIINGDNCWQKEYVKEEQIYGIVTRFYRRGKWHSCDERMYRFYSHLMVDLFCIRRMVLWVRDYCTRILRKIKHTLDAH